MSSPFDSAKRAMDDAVKVMRKASIDEPAIGSAFVLHGLDQMMQAHDCSMCQLERLGHVQALVANRMAELLHAIHPTGGDNEVLH